MILQYLNSTKEKSIHYKGNKKKNIKLENQQLAIFSLMEIVQFLGNHNYKIE